jgi:hypothetical protein
MRADLPNLNLSGLLIGLLAWLAVAAVFTLFAL